MNDKAYAAFRQEVLLEVTEQEYRIGMPQTQAQLEVTPSDLTGSPPQIRRGAEWSFTKLYDLGANRCTASCFASIRRF